MWGCAAVEALAGLTAIAIPDVRTLTRPARNRMLTGLYAVS